MRHGLSVFWLERYEFPNIARDTIILTLFFVTCVIYRLYSWQNENVFVCLVDTQQYYTIGNCSHVQCRVFSSSSLHRLVFIWFFFHLEAKQATFVKEDIEWSIKKMLEGIS